MAETVVVFHGARVGRKLSGESAFRAALAQGKRVITGGSTLNGVWFDVSVNDAGEVVYTALTAKPEGIDPLA